MRIQVLAGAAKFYRYSLNQNGQIVKYTNADEDYQTDVLSRLAVEFIDKAATDARPFFLYLSPTSPHSPFLPAPRHIGLMADAIAPRGPAFNEEDISDKPAWIQSYPLLTEDEKDQIQLEYISRMEMLLSVDDMVGAVVTALETVGAINDTYIIFTTDNGWMKGEHRLSYGKVNAYEESIRVPLIVRGPSVSASVSRDELVLNIDFSSTFSMIAGEASTVTATDGRSLLPLLNGDPVSHWRDKILIEYLHSGSNKMGIPRFSAVRDEQFKYVEYSNPNEGTELYDLWADPYELNSTHATASADLLGPLQQALGQLATCSGESCRDADGGTRDNPSTKAVADLGTTQEDVPLTIAVLDNDFSSNGEALALTEAAAENGEAQINPDGTVTYNPHPDFNGTDTLAYTVMDTIGNTATANVTLTIVPVNDAPVAVIDNVTTAVNTPVEIAILGNDYDVDDEAVVLNRVSIRAARGSVVENPNGTVTYTPPLDAQRTTSFDYLISDPQGATARGIVTVTIQ